MVGALGADERGGSTGACEDARGEDARGDDARGEGAGFGGGNADAPPAGGYGLPTFAPPTERVMRGRSTARGSTGTRSSCQSAGSSSGTPAAAS